MHGAITRRDWVKDTGCGFGALALAGLAADEATARSNLLAPKPPHFAPKAQRVNFPFLQGGGRRNYCNAFLPAVYQGTAIGKAGGPITDATIRDLASSLPSNARESRFDLLRELNAQQLKRAPGDAELEAVAESYELAWRMQM